jgi:hypothetical protein
MRPPCCRLRPTERADKCEYLRRLRSARARACNIRFTLALASNPRAIAVVRDDPRVASDWSRLRYLALVSTSNPRAIAVIWAGLRVSRMGDDDDSLTVGFGQRAWRTNAVPARRFRSSRARVGRANSRGLRSNCSEQSLQFEVTAVSSSESR